jgi:inorganic triphosphatase YgiF
MAKLPVEIEMKLIAPDAETLRTLPEALRALCSEVRPLGRRLVRDRYYDTADWRFHRAIYALRVRRTKGKAILAMKGLDRPRGGVSRREELEQVLPKSWRSFNRMPGGRVANRVKRIAGGEELCVLFAIRNRRTVYECRLGESLTVVASADDFIVEAGTRRQALYEVELEIKSGDVAALRKLGRQLARRLGLSTAHRAKFRQGIELAGLHPPGGLD